MIAISDGTMNKSDLANLLEDLAIRDEEGAF
jgi:hypothetical protein